MGLSGGLYSALRTCVEGVCLGFVGIELAFELWGGTLNPKSLNP